MMRENSESKYISFILKFIENGSFLNRKSI